MESEQGQAPTQRVIQLNATPDQALIIAAGISMILSLIESPPEPLAPPICIVPIRLILDLKGFTVIMSEATDCGLAGQALNEHLRKREVLDKANANIRYLREIGKRLLAEARPELADILGSE
jgi:hypothetical protein